MENYGSETFAIDADGSVLREVAGFFKEHPFLLVDEKRLAILLCRPLQMISEAVRTLEATGVLRRKGEETLICIAGQMADMKSE
jgi:hypothetical protein